MSHRSKTQSRSWMERALSLVLAAVLLAGTIPAMTLPTSAHWADQYLDQLVDWGVMRADQTANPDSPVTRAEFAGVINRAYGYTEKGEIPFEDVAVTDWFYDDISIAYTAGYMAGTSETTASPNETLTREMAVCILGRNMMMKETPGESLAFSDSRDVSFWAQGMVKTAVDNYIISGYPDNSFGPQDAISRGQMAVLVSQCLGNPISESGSYELGGVFGNVTITAPNVTLRNTTISGDLYVSGGVGLGGIKLENVNVLGRIIVSGTGESEGGDASVIMRNVTAEEMLVDNMRNKTVTIRADGITDIAKTTVRTNAYLEDNNTDDKGLMSIELDGEPGTRLTLAGRIKEVVNKTPNSYIQVGKGTVAKITVDEAATNSTVQLDRNTKVKEMNLDVGTTVTGEGDIEKLNINAPGSVVSMLPDKIYIRPGLTASIAGIVMDHIAAEEGSLDPRLLSGYPAARDIAPTGFRADFAGNKKGTIYWAVSAITDGSIREDDLISPPSYGSRAISNGSLAVPTGGEEISAQVTGLSVGGSYYLSAILVDEQLNRSPVKVISFSTPDNTVPAFGQGYPYMSLITKNVAQVTVMPTKSCKMYYALLPQGAQAPTVNDLKSAAVTGNLGYGVRDVTKNTESVFTVNSQRLEELKTYTLYLWLTDVDGVNSSAIVSLPVPVPDETPPIVDPEPYPAPTGTTGTTIALLSGMNEPGTIFWALVPQDADYPLPNKQSVPLDKDNVVDENGNAVTSRLESMYAKTCVESGRGALQRGQSAVANATTEVPININGLEPETTYDLYYVGKDTAGNYSKEVRKVVVKTQDTRGPIVYQYFSEYQGEDETENPLANSDIILDFNEQIVIGGSGNLLELYEKAAKGDAAAKQKFVGALNNETTDPRERNVVLYQRNERFNSQVEPVTDLTYATDAEERDKLKAGASAWIDFNQVIVRKSQVREGHIEIVFPNGKAVSMSSGRKYYFELRNVRDTAEPANLPMDKNGRPITLALSPTTTANTDHVLKEFETAFASVGLGQPLEFPMPKWVGSKATGTASDKKWSRQDGALADGEARVDAWFDVQPLSTQNVGDSIKYDILLFASESVSYDLYYRIVDTQTGNFLDATTHENKLPEGPDTKRTDAEAADDHGWIYLGNHAAIQPNGEGKYFGGVAKNVLKKNSGFPELKKLGEGLSYEFVISITQRGTSTTWAAWDKDVDFDVYVMAGTELQLAQAYQNGAADFTPEKIKNGSVQFISEPEPLKITAPFGDTTPPTFSTRSPRFSEGVTSSTLQLDLGGRTGSRLYYRIVAVDDPSQIQAKIKVLNDVSYQDNNGASHTVAKGTEVDSASGYGDFYQVIAAQMKVGTNGDNCGQLEDHTGLDHKALHYYDVLDDNNVLRDNIINLNGALRNWIRGSCQYTEVYGPEPIVIPGEGNDQLEPNKEYFFYAVLEGASQNISSRSPVYIFTFKTNAAAKPKIQLTRGSGEHFNVDTSYGQTANVETEFSWRLFDRQGVQLAEHLGTPLILSPAATDAKITGYRVGDKEIKTVLDALTTRYNHSNVVPSSVGNIEGFDSKYDGFSVFDVLADTSQKDALEEWIRGNAPLEVRSEGQNERTVNYKSSPNWVQNATSDQDVKKGAYIVLVAGHNVDSQPDDNGNFTPIDSFAAYDSVSYDNLDAPVLDEAMISSIAISGQDGDLRVEAYISLSFNKDVYWREGSGGSGTDYMVMGNANPPSGTTSGGATVGILNNLDPKNTQAQFEANGGGSNFSIQLTGANGSKNETFRLLYLGGRIYAKNGNIPGPQNGIVISVSASKKEERIPDPDNPGSYITKPYYEALVEVDYGDKHEEKTMRQDLPVAPSTQISFIPSPLVLNTSGNGTGTVAVNITNPPQDAVNVEVTAVSSNDSVATATGTPGADKYAGSVTVTAKGPGEADITVTVKFRDASGNYIDGGGRPLAITSSFHVTVKSPSVTITPGTVTMKKNETKTLTAKTENGPAGSVVEWKSSNPAVATVSANGVVTGVMAGTSVITATYKSGGVTLDVATAAVTVLPTQVTVTIIPPTNLSNSGSNKGSTIQLKAEVKVDGVVKNDATVTWTSSDTSVATVTPNGLVTVVGSKDQTFTITAKYVYLNSDVKGEDTFTRKIIETISGLNGLTTLPK